MEEEEEEEEDEEKEKEDEEEEEYGGAKRITRGRRLNKWSVWHPSQ